MQPGLAAFFVGFFLANAISHMLVALWDVNFASGFGMGKNRNIAYSIWNIALAGGLAIYAYGLDALLSNAFFWGVLALYVIHFATGRFFYLKWNSPGD